MDKADTTDAKERRNGIWCRRLHAGVTKGRGSNSFICGNACTANCHFARFHSGATLIRYFINVRKHSFLNTKKNAGIAVWLKPIEDNIPVPIFKLELRLSEIDKLKSSESATHTHIVNVIKTFLWQIKFHRLQLWATHQSFAQLMAIAQCPATNDPF